MRTVGGGGGGSVAAAAVEAAAQCVGGEKSKPRISLLCAAAPKCRRCEKVGGGESMGAPGAEGVSAKPCGVASVLAEGGIEAMPGEAAGVAPASVLADNPPPPTPFLSAGHTLSSLKNLSVSLANTATAPLARPASTSAPSGEMAAQVIALGTACHSTTFPVSMFHTRSRMSAQPVRKHAPCCCPAPPPRPADSGSVGGGERTPLLPPMPWGSAGEGKAAMAVTGVPSGCRKRKRQPSLEGCHSRTLPSLEAERRK